MSTSRDREPAGRLAGLTRRATHTPFQGPKSARAGTRPGAPAPSFACLTLLGYSKLNQTLLHPGGVREQSFEATRG